MRHLMSYGPPTRTLSARLVAFVVLTLTTVLVALGAVMLLAVVAASASAQEAGRIRGGGRLAVVNTEMLLDSAPRRADADRQYSEQVERAERLLKAVGDSLRLAVDDLSRLQERLSRAEREASLHLVRAREIHLEEMVQQMEAAMAREREALRAPILASVREAVRAVRVREGWGAIVDRASLGEVSDVDAAVDVTTRVLAEMRARDGTSTGPRPTGRPVVRAARGAVHELPTVVIVAPMPTDGGGRPNER